MPAITPFLWFDDQAEAAVDFYCSVFPDAEVLHVARYGPAGPGPEGAVMAVRFSLEGAEFTALNGGPSHAGFDETISFVIDCADQAEVDRYWAALTEGGEEIACGWLRDRFGLCWQVVPAGLPEVLGDPVPERAERAMRAMLQMKKLDLDTLRAAADGIPSPA
ncbi:VOC family protein [Acidimicrobiaceae bacterium USS-CC1]|uniref:VOC family protein n=1 Tax=Acidiferrimicrobium australe TaxID=2664430 RepID=A0ABW9QYX6_9ACTN|nr:VOC family protein [Acidiferrimicrobium australe]